MFTCLGYNHIKRINLNWLWLTCLFFSFFLKMPEICRDELHFHQRFFKKVVKCDPATLCCWFWVSERNSLQVERRGVKHYAANLLYPKALLETIILETPEATWSNESCHVKEKNILKVTSFQTFFIRPHGAVNCFLTARQVFSLSMWCRKLTMQLWSKWILMSVVTSFILCCASQF